MSYSKRKQKAFLYRFCATLITAAIIILLINARITPILTRCVKMEAENFASDAIDKSIIRLLKAKNIKYTSIVNIERSKSGIITAITTDTTNLNLLKSEICNKISDIIEEQGDFKVKLPIGAIFGSEVFSGIGPYIKYRLYTIAVTDCEIKNEFQSVGINQTQHRLMFEITTKIYVIFPKNNICVPVTTKICVAETVIIGITPGSAAVLTS